ncbi:RES family NAD+ phosphorylase [Arthrobacter sp. JSM 101049]|uniref:RES family NAD+ phosphorylase n=1 Tax=Arthrobacter sp. JSM 101049 TaxID=929097 RepID=UPI0035667DC9
MLTPDGRTVDPRSEILPAGSGLSRVHSAMFGAADYNPGPTPAAVETRFAFFGTPTVPVLYAAQNDDAAIAETLLHDVPLSGGRLDEALVRRRVLSKVASSRDLHLLVLHGDGFRRLGTDPEEITRTSPRHYGETVRWAAAAHAAGFDGMVWMSRLHDSARSYVFFGTSASRDDFQTVPGSGRAFAFDHELDWLSRRLGPLNIRIVAVT